jgi:hypothetical protein
MCCVLFQVGTKLILDEVHSFKSSENITLLMVNCHTRRNVTGSINEFWLPGLLSVSLTAKSSLSSFQISM